MNILDLFILIPLAWGAYKGFKRGLVFEILMLIGLILGLYLAFKFSDLMYGFVSSLFDTHGAMVPVISFVMVFLAILLVTVFLAKLLDRILKVTMLSTLNKIAGAAFGILKFTLIVSVLLWLFRGLEPYWNFIGKDLKQESLLYKPVMKASSFITPALEDIREEFMEKVGEGE